MTSSRSCCIFMPPSCPRPPVETWALRPGLSTTAHSARADAFADGVAPAIREAQAARANTLRQIAAAERRGIGTARGRQVGAAGGRECASTDRVSARADARRTGAAMTVQGGVDPQRPPITCSRSTRRVAEMAPAGDRYRLHPVQIDRKYSDPFRAPRGEVRTCGQYRLSISLSF